MSAADIRSSDPQQVVDAIIERVGKQIVLALPLGIGKANHVANALFARALDDPSLSLKILTALTLEAPQGDSELARRFLEPIMERYFGGYPPLRYAEALREGTLPENIEVHEFFLQPGRWLGNPVAQQNHPSLNYTHVTDQLLRSGVNVLAQLVAPPSEGEAPERFSLSSNPDISVELFAARERGEANFLAVAEVNRNLPYMGGAAEVAQKSFAVVLENDATHFPLFTLPHEPVTLSDHAIGLHAASLVPDGGTLQVGIGSGGDAVIHALLLRHKQPQRFRQLLEALGHDTSASGCHTEPFREGLYGASEMFVEGFLHLLEAGILTREVDGIVLHAGFFIGSPLFYRKLRALPTEQRAKIAMMPISFTNTLYGDEEQKRHARRGARFINSALMATLNGAVVSDGLEDGRVISGVGGQYNFVAMAHALAGGRSALTLHATRTKRGTTRSNIRWNYGHVTIPRHLRDIVITEYGIADLRGSSDAEVIAAMLAVSDSRFQQKLLEQAKDAGKIANDYQIPVSHRSNIPQRLAATLQPFVREGLLPNFPLGSDFTPEEELLAPALSKLGEQSGSKRALAKLALRGWRRRPDESQRSCLERMGLAEPESWSERLYRALLLAML